MSGRLTPAAAVACVTAVTACGASAAGSSQNWHSLTSVRVTVQNASLPPPYGRPKTRTFTTPSAVTQATTQLNRFKIRSAPGASTASCTGGFQTTVTIAAHDQPTRHLSAYSCAGKTSGIGGNLAGYLSAIGLSPG